MNKTILITGAARRVGAEIARYFHRAGYTVALHCFQSLDTAKNMIDAFNHERADSAILLQGDLADPLTPKRLLDSFSENATSLDVLVNNAAVFFPTPLAEAGISEWQTIMDINLRAPFLMCQAALPWLRESQGCVVNITDIYGERALRDHPIYCASKAGLIGLTRALANDLAPGVRVNGISPGPILWNERDNEQTKNEVLRKTPLQRRGDPSDIAATVQFLVDSKYMTGAIVNVDGGRSLHI